MPLDLEQMRKDQAAADAASSKFEKVKYMTLNQGLNKIRILPPKEPRKTPYLKINAAWVGPNNRKVILPPNTEWSEDCPLRQEIERLMASGSEADRKLAGKMQPKERFCYFVIDRAEESEGPKLLELTSRNFTLVNAYFMNPEYGDISDPATGVDGNINYTPGNKTANGFPDFQFFPSRHSSPLAENPETYAAYLEEDWFEHYGIGQPSDKDYISAALAGREQEFIEARKNSGGSAGEVKHPYQPMDKFWIVVNGQSQETTAIDIAAEVSAGKDPQICSQADPSAGWVLASQAGFVKAQAPASPAAPPQAPTLPPAGPPAAPAAPTTTTPADAARAIAEAMAAPAAPEAPTAPWESAQPDNSQMPMPAAPAAPAAPTVATSASSQVLQDLKAKLG